MISIIAIIGKNKELGKDNKLIWNIPEDLKRFRTITAAHPIIMGRKTFESIGRPLPNRVNIVITTDLTYTAQNIRIVHTLQDALDVASNAPGKEEIFIIGGGTIYTQAINIVDRLYLTVVDESADADTFFPEYSSFTKIIENTPQSHNTISFKYLTLER